MKSLVKINSAVIGKDEVNAVDARELHDFLGSKQDFSTWIKKRIKDYKFKEGNDFELLHKKMEQISGAILSKVRWYCKEKI